jgi:hypothetical protein
MAQTQSFPYYQDMLKLIWHGVKRSKLYEYDMIHGINCICCSKILQAGNDQGNDKKSKSKLGRKPGGHNRK